VKYKSEIEQPLETHERGVARMRVGRRPTEQIRSRQSQARAANEVAQYRLYHCPTAEAAWRRAMIAECAYYRAERRGFAPGHEREDWLQAEREIDAELALGHTPVPSGSQGVPSTPNDPLGAPGKPTLR
jgi:hypothetical protein